MRKTLLATTALAFAGAMAAGPALAADMLSIGVGGYMQQWIGMSSVDATNAKGEATAVEGGVAQQSDSEIFFKGRLESDNGLTFSVKVELEGNTQATSMIDESQLTVRGAFGEIVLGAEDPAITITHHGVRDAGFGMLCGDMGKWINGISECGPYGMGTAAHALGDRNQISYYSPRINGVQFGATYVPNTGQEARNAPLHNNDTDAWSLGGNYKGDMGGGAIAVSAGYYQASRSSNVVMLEEQALADANASIKALSDVATKGVLPSGLFLEDVAQEAGQATKEIADATKAVLGDRTVMNLGLNVGFGAFSFDVAYLAQDGGVHMADAMGKAVENPAHDNEVVAFGAMYSDGPMAVSLSHTMVDADDGTEQSGTMLSGSYSLAPGIAWKSSLFAAEKSSGTDKSSVEGNGFVTGFTLSF